ncbi:transcriptional corepressor SEUSS-like [Olea europaea var. sylvestris]|uniref:transcriptional corepressor SEUSS-like n=1 Tax=Olea europaea var. sylvestris TaxID=158386 RepID=UPI000C1D2ED3|nr:transcriptional corepressor SEUSS-like [Olea europaea var. sylvestris]
MRLHAPPPEFPCVTIMRTTSSTPSLVQQGSSLCLFSSFPQRQRREKNIKHKARDNNIEFWRKFVAEYFAPNAKKRWCVSMYGSGRQAAGVFPQDVWHCEICNRKPGRGFEATVEVLPRLFKIKYESGILEELLYVDMPREYQNLSGQIVLDYSKAIQESVFEQLRVVRDGQLRIVFSPDLKICSWEFCARRHEELIPRRFSESLAKIPRRTNTSPGSFQGQLQQSQQQQQTVGPNSKNDSTAQAASVQLTSTNNIPGVKNSLNPAPGTSSTTATVGLHHQNSSRQNLTSNANSPFRGNPVQMPSPGSSNTMPQPSPHFQPPMPSTSNNPPQSSHGAQMNSANSPNNPMQLPTLTADADANDSQSSVQKILHDMMMSNQFSGGGMTGIRTMGSDVKNINGMLSSDNAVIRSGVANGNPVIGGGDFRNTGNGFGHSAMANGIQAALGSKSMNGRAGGMTMARDQSAIQQQDLGNQLLGGLGAVNGFNNLQFN